MDEMKTPEEMAREYASSIHCEVAVERCPNCKDLIECFKYAFTVGYAQAIEDAAETVEPHKPNCQRWECGNCMRAGAIRALAPKREGG